MSPLRYFTLFILLMLAGCGGYSFGEGDISVLAPEYRTIAVGKISNPTTLSWLEPRVRKLLRDELNNRGSITWVDTKAGADAVISIDIQRYNRPTAVAGEYDETLRSVAIFQFEATIRSTTDDSVLWRSSLINQDWPFFTGDEEEADMEVTRLGIRRLADQMSQNY
ncbi:MULTISPECIES: LPS assembly lipoprotein LptE [unclassified Pseudodesulfovibrio]|uniref:LPS assembly lipoprotein LptE n=1 Tax=unclassified Pseudodesulfovibrio TaxID=2661612 RepID=UPI000FEB62A1|nr:MULTISPECIES: LPS assembly lipoprotein LptE [unclassified Pseudodesulfovibrio]MCJ2165963.1 LPS assembly lipoprotein LptE [Pseudodesulfovibrio sp. S3-i]RWU02636.1 hypothetical protein DWB63_15350 [Pseudodesulfovibrio sp. S3]